MAVKKEPTIALDSVALTPVTVILGAEGALVDRAVNTLKKKAADAGFGAEVEERVLSGYQKGQLNQWVSPSLFQESKTILLEGAEAAPPQFTEDLEEYLADPLPEVLIILRHRGGNANRKIVQLLDKKKARFVICTELKRDSDKVALIQEEVRASGARMSAAAAQELVSASGKDLYELLGVTRQLLSDHGGGVTEEHVRDHFAGRIEASGFEVAAAIANRQGPRALLLARRAFASKVDPVPIVAVLGMKMRELAKVKSSASPRDLGMPNWKLQQILKEARQWDEESIGEAICLVALADEDVKGGSRDPYGAVEKCIIAISRLKTRS